MNEFRAAANLVTEVFSGLITAPQHLFRLASEIPSALRGAKHIAQHAVSWTIPRGHQPGN